MLSQDSSFNYTFEQFELPEISLPPSPAPSYAPAQSYASIYGSRFRGCEFTLVFEAPESANGSKDTLRERRRHMDSMRSLVERAIADDGISSEIAEMRFSPALCMVTFTSTGAAADKLMARLQYEPYFSSLADTTGSVFYIPENPPRFPLVWAPKSGFVALPREKEDELGRYSLRFGSNDEIAIRYAIGDALAAAGLDEAIGADFRQAASGSVTLTCLRSELAHFVRIPGLTSITSLEAQFAGGDLSI